MQLSLSCRLCMSLPCTDSTIHLLFDCMIPGLYILNSLQILDIVTQGEESRSFLRLKLSMKYITTIIANDYLFLTLLHAKKKYYFAFVVFELLSFCDDPSVSPQTPESPVSCSSRTYVPVPTGSSTLPRPQSQMNPRPQPLHSVDLPHVTSNNHKYYTLKINCTRQNNESFV